MIFSEESLNYLVKPINEVYIGRTKEILQIENQIHKIREMHMGKYILNMGINSSREILELNRMIEDTFGFGCFSFNILNEKNINAFTLPIGNRFDTNPSKKSIVSTKNGFKLKKEKKYAGILYIYSGLIFNEKYTDDEIMGIILHEIGHNFQETLSKNGGIVNIYAKALSVPLAFLKILLDPKNGLDDLGANITNLNILHRLSNKINKILIKNNSIFLWVNNVLAQYNSIMSNAINLGFKILNVSTLGLYSLVMSAWSSIIKFATSTSLVSLLSLPISAKMYNDENISDNFATMYGYGDALSSALIKMEDTKNDPSIVIKAVNSIPVIGTLYNMNMSTASIITTAFDEHPFTIYRAQNQLEMLKKETTKSDLDPKMKARINDDIKSLEKIIDEYINKTKSIKDPNFVNKVWSSYLSKSMDLNLINSLTHPIKTTAIDKNTNYSEKDRYENYDKIFNDVKLK